MPKSKEIIDTSSGSDSDEPKPKKKKEAEKMKVAKDSSDSEAKSSATKGPNGETMFELGRMRYATVSEFKGKVLVSIREYYQADNGIRPGKKGISLSVDQWKALKEVMSDVDKAVKEM